MSENPRKSNIFKDSLALLKSDEADAVNLRKLLRFALVLFLLFAICFGLTFVFLLRGQKAFQLPEYRNQDILKVLDSSSRLKLNTQILPKYSIDVPAYTVIQQRPDPGTLVKPNRRIQLTVSLGKKVTEMPDFKGKSLEEARVELQTLFSAFERPPLIVENRQYSAKIPANLIMSQAPKAGEPINYDKSISFLISRGIATNEISVPNYRFKNFKEVRTELEDLGIDVRMRAVEVSRSKDVGKILKQSINKDSRLKRGDSIQFDVGVARDFSLEGVENRPVVRVITIKVPYLTSQLQSEEEASIIDNDNSERLNSVRMLSVLVEDQLGREMRFEEKVVAGQTIDVPYETVGRGKVTIFIDKDRYLERSF